MNHHSLESLAPPLTTLNTLLVYFFDEHQHPKRIFGLLDLISSYLNNYINDNLNLLLDN